MDDAITNAGGTIIKSKNFTCCTEWTLSTNIIGAMFTDSTFQGHTVLPFKSSASGIKFYAMDTDGSIATGTNNTYDIIVFYYE